MCVRGVTTPWHEGAGVTQERRMARTCGMVKKKLVPQTALCDPPLVWELLIAWSESLCRRGHPPRVEVGARASGGEIRGYAP